MSALNAAALSWLHRWWEKLTVLRIYALGDPSTWIHQDPLRGSTRINQVYIYHVDPPGSVDPTLGERNIKRYQVIAI